MPAARRAVRLICLAGGLASLLPAAAAAAPPGNDARASADPLTLPASVTGTTEDSTLEPPFESQPSCAGISGSVWYAVTAPRNGSIVVRLNMDGDQDATVEVIRRVRSQLTPVACERTNDAGNAAFTANVVKDGTYLIRVGRRFGSAAGGFRLDAKLADPPPAFPGRPLPRAGARGTLDRLADPLDAFTVRLRAGVSYLITAGTTATGCSTLQLFGPVATEFADAVARDCDWVFFTPSVSGRFPILLGASRTGADVQSYRLRARAVRRDDVSPGLALRNLAKVRGIVNAPGGDPLDTYRFDVGSRSQLDVSLGAGQGQEVRAIVVTAGGRPVGQYTTADREPIVVGRGRYYVVVVSDGRAAYTIQRTVRTITRTRLSTRARVPLGAVASLGVRISPRVPGPVAVTIERFEPAFGWQFDRKVSVRAVNGRAVVRFRPGRSGLWRAGAEFLGTRTAAPSFADAREFSVTEPLAP
jgi:hypothetical protein